MSRTEYTVSTFRADVRRGPFAWPGGYPLYYVTADGGTLCPDCAYTERRQIIEAIRDNDQSGGWRVIGQDANWEDPDMDCANCNKRIESAYAEDEVPDAYMSVDEAEADLCVDTALSWDHGCNDFHNGAALVECDGPNGPIKVIVIEYITDTQGNRDAVSLPDAKEIAIDACDERYGEGHVVTRTVRLYS